MTTLKNPIFIGFFGLFHFFFFFFLFLFFQHKKGKNKKCNFLFENLIFDIPQILQKHYFDTLLHYLCFSKCPQNTIKMGEKQWKKNLDHFLTLNLDHFLTLKPPNLGPLFNFTAYIYIIFSKENTLNSEEWPNLSKIFWMLWPKLFLSWG